MGQLTTPWKMDEKLKSENMQKRAVLYVYVRVGGIMRKNFANYAQRF